MASICSATSEGNSVMTLCSWRWLDTACSFVGRWVVFMLARRAPGSDDLARGRDGHVGGRGLATIHCLDRYLEPEASPSVTCCADICKPPDAMHDRGQFGGVSL